MPRYRLLDELRGTLILLVLIYHLLYDITLFFPTARGAMWLMKPDLWWLRAIVPGGFLLLCGACCHFSRSNLRRGLLCAVFAAGITAVSYLVTPQTPIRWGMLHLLAACLLLWCLLHRWGEKLPWGWGALLGFALFFFTARLSYGTIGLGWRLPEALKNHNQLFILGFPTSGIGAADYFPLLPWSGLFFAGSCFGRGISLGWGKEFFTQNRSPGMARIGRHTLALYLLHQPVWFALLAGLRLWHG